MANRVVEFPSIEFRIVGSEYTGGIQPDEAIPGSLPRRFGRGSVGLCVGSVSIKGDWQGGSTTCLTVRSVLFHHCSHRLRSGKADDSRKPYRRRIVNHHRVVHTVHRSAAHRDWLWPQYPFSKHRSSADSSPSRLIAAILDRCRPSTRAANRRGAGGSDRRRGSPPSTGIPLVHVGNRPGPAR